MVDVSRAAPRPWKIVHSDPAQGVDVWWLCAGKGNAEMELGSIQGGYPQERGEANAAMIVTSVNHFEELVTALRYVQTLLAFDLKHLITNDGSGYYNQAVKDTFDRVGAVLAKVTT